MKDLFEKIEKEDKRFEELFGKFSDKEELTPEEEIQWKKIVSDRFRWHNVKRSIDYSMLFDYFDESYRKSVGLTDVKSE